MNKRTLALLAVMLFVAPMLASCWDPAPNDEPSNEAKRKYALFIEQIQFWTDSEAIDLSTIGRTDRATVHLTYLAPQLIDAAIDYQMELKGKSWVDKQWVRDEVNRRLQDYKRIPFVLTVQPTTMPGYSVSVNLPTSLSLYTVSGRIILPSEFDRIFVEQFSGTKIRSGYVFFPLGDNPNQRLNLDEEPSLTVKMKDFLFMPNRAGFQKLGAQFFWNFNLVPADIPIQELEKLEVAPTQSLSTIELDAIVSTVMTVVNMFM